MIMGYGHFNIEHNKGHHTWVATPEDPASSRMGESFYAFLMLVSFLEHSKEGYRL